MPISGKERFPGIDPLYGPQAAYAMSGTDQVLLRIERGVVDGNSRHQALGGRRPMLFSGHSQMGTTTNFRARDMFLTQRSRFDRVSIRSHFLNRQLQRSRNLIRE